MSATLARWLAAGTLLLAALHGKACDEPAADASRIAAAGGSITEILYALGEQQRLVAVDTTSNYPADATRLPSVGYVRNLSAEGLLSMSPTLILGEHDMGPDVVLDQVADAGVTVARVPEEFSVQGIVDKVLCVGTLIGRREHAGTYVETQLRPIIAQLRTARDGAEAPRVAVLLTIREGAPMAAGAETSGNGLLTMAGGHNVFAGFSGWKPVSLEHMATAAPDYIVISERGASSAGGVAALASDPAIRMTPAGREQRIAVLDGMAMLGFGPRTLSTALTLKERLDRR